MCLYSIQGFFFVCHRKKMINSSLISKHGDRFNDNIAFGEISSPFLFHVCRSTADSILAVDLVVTFLSFI